MERRQLLILTEDGSKTIYLPELDETYHSSHGAIQEAKHVFIQHGTSAIQSASFRVFEMGFGTGLNALLTLVESETKNLNIHYTGIEAYPVELELAKQLDYCTQIGEEYFELFQQLHTVEWNKTHQITPHFSFEKIHQKIEEYTIEEESFDCVFYDAFGPRAQEEMWDISILEKMYRMLQPNGFLVTYCAKGQVKRDLKSLGFIVESLPGPPGKREMTRAWKKVNQ